MKALAAVVGFLVIACAPPLEKRLKPANFAATSTPLLTVSKRVEALEAVRASLPPREPPVPTKPSAPVKKPKR